MNSIIR